MLNLILDLIRVHCQTGFIKYDLMASVKIFPFSATKHQEENKGKWLIYFYYHAVFISSARGSSIVSIELKKHSFSHRACFLTKRFSGESRNLTRLVQCQLHRINIEQIHSLINDIQSVTLYPGKTIKLQAKVHSLYLILKSQQYYSSI